MHGCRSERFYRLSVGSSSSPHSRQTARRASGAGSVSSIGSVSIGSPGLEDDERGLTVDSRLEAQGASAEAAPDGTVRLVPAMN